MDNFPLIETEKQFKERTSKQCGLSIYEAKIAAESVERVVRKKIDGMLFKRFFIRTK